MRKNILGSLAIATALAFGTTPTHAQSAPDAIVLKTKDKVAEICALGITVRKKGINQCDEIERQKMIQAIADEKEKHLYEQLALLFAILFASGLAGKKIFDINKQRLEEQIKRKNDEYRNHGEQSGSNWDEIMKSSTSGKSDSTNTERTGIDHELEAKIWAIEEERRIKREKRAKNTTNGSEESSDGIEESESKRTVDFSDTAILPEENQSAGNIPSDWTKTVKIETP